MKTIETELFGKDYAEYSAIFFTDDGIIVESKTSSPVLQYTKTINQLELLIETVYLDNSILIVKCQSSLTLDQVLNNGFYIQNAKTFLGLTNQEEIQKLILRSVHWLTWDANLQFCSKCGGEIQKVFATTEKKCNLCNLSFFPKLSPAVMVVIQRKNEILLARSAHFNSGVYSAIAGFIDIGETAESAVHREVKEEVGLEISELTYFKTQSWPFPDSFMIAFKAKYLRGTINIDMNEIEDARWFNLNNLPQLPSYPSVSRELIDSFIQ